MKEPLARKHTLFESKNAFVEELEFHNLVDVADAYSRGEISEKRIAVLMGHSAAEALTDGDEDEYSAFAGIMLLASFLHEGKHTRPSSQDALRCFWDHLERVHPERG